MVKSHFIDSSQIDRPPPIVERFLATNPDADQCWPWPGFVTSKGYGSVQFYTGGKRYATTAHRFMYILLIGAIGEGLEVDHQCTNHNCVNPNHMRPATPRENLLRGSAPAAINARKTKCPRGHSLSGDNLLPALLRSGKRSCLTCYNDRKEKSKND